MADGDARAELLTLAVRKIVEEALEAEVAEAVGREYYENGAVPSAGYRNGSRRPKGPSSMACRRWRIGRSRSFGACAQS